MRRIIKLVWHQLFLLVISLSMVLSLAACASTGTRNNSSGSTSRPDSNADGGNAVDTAAPGGGDEATIDLNRKIITNTDIRMESTDVPQALRELASLAREEGGYIQSQYQTESSDNNFYGELVVRIPAESVDRFVAAIESHGKIRENEVSIQDVTAEYTDTESRLENARVQESRLLEMFEEANTIDEMLYIQSELDRLQERIEVYEGQIQLWDNLVDLSTVSIQLYTDSSLIGSDPDIPRYIPADTVWQRFTAGINRSFINFVNAAALSLIWAGENFVQILFALIIAIILIILIRRSNRKHKENRAQMNAYTVPMNRTIYPGSAAEGNTNPVGQSPYVGPNPPVPTAPTAPRPTTPAAPPPPHPPTAHKQPTADEVQSMDPEETEPAD